MATTLDNDEYRIREAVEQASAALSRADIPGARAIARPVLDAGLEHPFLIRVEALWLHQNGELQEALRTYHHARSLDPQDPMILNGIAGVVAAMGQNAAALKLLEASLALAPQLDATHYLKAWILETVRDFAGARASYEQALHFNPGHVEAWAGLATSCARLGDYASARGAAANALERAPGQPTATIALALADLAEGLAKDAEARTQPLTQSSALPPMARAIAWGVLGDARDAQNRTDEAFDAYARENALLQEIHQAARGRALEVPAQLQRLAADLAAMPAPIPSSAQATSGPAKQHVFLLGFMRSGATLLEQALASHPDVVILDEADLLGEAAATYLGSAEGLSRLAAASELELDAIRSAYWQGVADRGHDAAGKVFVDKLPLHTIKLPLIARLFPGAKILFAVRDPRDVVFSCFRSHIEINVLTYCFLELQSAARLYDAAMAIGAWSLDKLPLSSSVVRHETLVEDFEAQTRKISELIGLEWNDQLRDFAAQVPRLASQENVGRWRAYADKLEPVLPILAPWVRHFGYGEA